MHERSAVKNSVSTYMCYTPDGLFWLNLYRRSQYFTSTSLHKYEVNLSDAVNLAVFNHPLLLAWNHFKVPYRLHTANR